MIDVLSVRRVNGHSHTAAGGNGNGKVKDVNLTAIEQAVRTILQAVGEDPNRPGLLDTPGRVARM